MRWVVGDIHGMLRPLERIIDAVDANDSHARLVFLGDYVNRGPDSAGVLDLLSGLPDATFLRGNHDDVFDLLLSGRAEAPHPDLTDPIAAFLTFIQHGLDRTLLSYDVPLDVLERAAARPTPRAIAACFDAVPEAHRAFIRRLPLAIEDHDFFAVHAYLAPDDSGRDLLARLADDAMLRRLAVWGRFAPDAVFAPKAWDRRGFVGHTSVEHYPSAWRDDTLRPIAGERLTLLDTACALREDGVLSAVCVEDGRVIRIARDGGIVESPPPRIAV
jgi:serine/threonine protein phosphatase 1